MTREQLRQLSDERYRRAARGAAVRTTNVEAVRAGMVWQGAGDDQGDDQGEREEARQGELAERLGRAERLG